MYGNLPKEGATPRLSLPKQGKEWCFQHEAPVYKVFMSLIQCQSIGQFFTPTNHHPVFIVSDQMLDMVGGANSTDQRKSTDNINQHQPAHAIHRRHLVENLEMT